MDKQTCYKMLKDDFLQVELDDELIIFFTTIDSLTKHILLLSRQYSFTRAISRLVDEANSRLLVIVEHQHYPLRIKLNIDLSNLNDGVLPSLVSAWRMTEIWEYSTFYQGRLLFKPSKLLFNCVQDQHRGWQPPHMYLQGYGQFHFHIEEKYIQQLCFDLSIELPDPPRVGMQQTLELWPYFIEKNYFSQRYNLTLLYFQSIEMLLGIEVKEIVVIKKMVLLELERMEQIVLFLTQFCREHFLSLVVNLLKEWQAKWDMLLFENSNNTFGFLYPRCSGNKFSGQWLKEVYSFLKYSALTMRKVQRVLRGNSFLISKHYLFNSQLDNSDLDGLLAKCNGFQHDMRFNSPYFYYQDLGTTPIIGGGQTPWDVMLLLFEEFFLSIKHLKTLIKGVPLHFIEVEVPLIDMLNDFKQECSNLSSFPAYFGIESLQGENSLWWKFEQNCSTPVFSLAGFGNLSAFMQNSHDVTLDVMQENLPLWMIDLPGSLL